MSDATKPTECEVCSRRGGEICNCLEWAIAQVDPVYEPGRSSAKKALAALRTRIAELERELNTVANHRAKVERELDDFKSRTEAACAVARAQGKTLDELRAENERLRGLLDRALGYTRCTPPCAGYDDALACKCGRVQLDDEISEAALGNAQEARDGTSAA